MHILMMAYINMNRKSMKKDQEVLKMFFPNVQRERKTLTDLIMEKIESQNLTKNKTSDQQSLSNTKLLFKVCCIY